MSRTKRDAEYNNRHTKRQRQQMRRCFFRQHLNRLGHRSNLQRYIWQYSHQHKHGDREPGRSSAISKGQQIGDGRQLIITAQPEYRGKQIRPKQKCGCDTQIDCQKGQATIICKTDTSIECPGCGVDTKRQRINSRVFYNSLWHIAVLTGISDKKKYTQINQSNQKQQPQFNPHVVRL